jgi:hypothetical protein
MAIKLRWFIAGDNMLDIIFILISLVFFGVAWGMVKLCEHV